MTLLGYVSYPRFKATYTSGTAVYPLVGGKLYTYQAGTSAPLATYTTSAGVSQNTNPVILDANGEADVYLALGYAYKFVLKDSNDITIWTKDGLVDSGSNLEADLANSTDAAKGDYLVAVKQPWTSAVARNQHDVNQDVKCIFDWMTSAQIADARAFTYSLDLSTPIQAALDYAASTNTGIYFPSAGYGINKPLKLGTACRIYGENALTTVIKMRSLPITAIPSFTGSTSHPTTAFDYHPMLYNTSGIQWGSIENICLDGNNLNVYGLRLQENFYMDFYKVLITQCNKYAYINIRGQSLLHNHLILYKNHGGMLMYNNTAVTFDTCGFERTGAVYGIQIMTPFSTKSGISFRDSWFEDDVAPWNTTGTVIEVSGRNPVFDNTFFSFVGTVVGISGTGTAKTMTVDGIAMVNDAGCIEGRFKINASTALTHSFSSDSYNNHIEGVFDSMAVTDAGVRNSWDYGASAYHSKVISDVTALRHKTTGEYWKLDPATTTLTLWGNANHRIALESGIFRMVSANGMTLRATNGDLSFECKPVGNFYFSDTTGAQNWEEGHIVLGPYHLWVNSAGKLYIKNGAPTGDTDGTIVGTQT